MRIKPFWIRTTNIGYKKILIFLMISGGILAAQFIWPLPHFAQIILIALFILITASLFKMALSKGIVIIHKEIAVQKTKLIIKDTLFPLQPHLSLRVIDDPVGKCSWSFLPLQQSQTWVFLDCIRKIIVHNKPKNQRALVLGGGGGTVPLQLLETFGINSDAVEISQEIIQIAQDFFLPLRKKILGGDEQKLQFIKGDAIRYVTSNTKKYGVVVIDLFDGNTPISAITHPAFIQRLQTTGEIVFVNFGIHNVSKDLQKKLHTYIHAYLQGFRSGRVYLSRQNYIGVFSNKREIQGTIDEQRII